MLKKILHEPLVHFLVLGALIFLFYAKTNDGFTQEENKIILTKAQLKQINYRWKKKHFRAPTQEEEQELIERAIYREVMSREALKMGLDKNDPIIKRRLEQKLAFLSSDMSALIEPTEKVLKVYLQANAERFSTEIKMRFIEIYIDPVKHKDLDGYVAKVKMALQQDTTVEGDTSMWPRENTLRSKSNVSRTFGKVFAERLFSLEEKEWFGPIKSAYGLHFVFVEEKTGEVLPQLDEIRVLLRNEWMNAQKEKNDRIFYENLKKNYTIKIEK